MASRLNTLMFAALDDVFDLAFGDGPALTAEEVRAVVINLIQRVQSLERTVDALSLAALTKAGGFNHQPKGD